MKIISVANKKGGVGKTTASINIGAGLQQLGYTVLLVDLDAQANLTTGLGFKKHAYESNVYSVLSSGSSQLNVLNRNGLYLLPSSPDLHSIDVELSKNPDSIFLISDIFRPITDFDYIIFDCPAQVGHLTTSAIIASDQLVIPLESEFFSLEGLTAFLQTFKRVQERLNPSLEYKVLINKHNSSFRLHRDVVKAVREHYGAEAMFETIVRQNVALAEAPSRGLSIFEHAPDSNGAEDFARVCHEIINQE